MLKRLLIALTILLLLLPASGEAASKRQKAIKVKADRAVVLLKQHSAQGDDVSPIPGTRKIERMAENAAAADIVLSPEDIAAIESAFPSDEVEGGRYT